jgi:hypothetical protein
MERILFRKNFRHTPLTRLQVTLPVLLLAKHRLVNHNWASSLGLVEGAVQVLPRYIGEAN